MITVVFSCALLSALVGDAVSACVESCNQDYAEQKSRCLSEDSCSKCDLIPSYKNCVKACPENDLAEFIKKDTKLKDIAKKLLICEEIAELTERIGT